MDLYREMILDHYKHPRNFGHLDTPDIVVEEGNVTCGDRIVMECKFMVHGSSFTKQIENLRFSGEGCAISQAAASMLTEKVKGITTDQITKFVLPDILDMLGTTLTPSRIQCAMLSLEVLQKAIHLAVQKLPIGFRPEVK